MSRSGVSNHGMWISLVIALTILGAGLDTVPLSLVVAIGQEDLQDDTPDDVSDPSWPGSVVDRRVQDPVPEPCSLLSEAGPAISPTGRQQTILALAACPAL